VNELRERLAAVSRAIKPMDALEAQHIAATLDWIASGAPLWRIQKPDKPPQHLVAYFVLLDELEQQLLLVDHKLAGLWLPGGGHVEAGEEPQQTVVRECAEELQVTAEFVWSQPIFLTVTPTVGTVARHTDVSLWYVLRGDCQQLIVFDLNEFLGVTWFPLDQLPYERADPHLERFVRKLQGRLSASF